MLLDRADFLTAGHNKNFLRSPDVSEYVYQPLKMPIGMYPIADADVMCTKNKENSALFKDKSFR